VRLSKNQPVTANIELRSAIWRKGLWRGT